MLEVEVETLAQTLMMEPVEEVAAVTSQGVVEGVLAQGVIIKNTLVGAEGMLQQQ